MSILIEISVPKSIKKQISLFVYVCLDFNPFEIQISVYIIKEIHNISLFKNEIDTSKYLCLK